jgi:hypothetical protein
MLIADTVQSSAGWGADVSSLAHRARLEAYAAFSATVVDVAVCSSHAAAVVLLLCTATLAAQQ